MTAVYYRILGLDMSFRIEISDSVKGGYILRLLMPSTVSAENIPTVLKYCDFELKDKVIDVVCFRMPHHKIHNKIMKVIESGKFSTRDGIIALAELGVPFKVTNGEIVEVGGDGKSHQVGRPDEINKINKRTNLESPYVDSDDADESDDADDSSCEVKSVDEDDVGAVLAANVAKASKATKVARVSKRLMNQPKRQRSQVIWMLIMGEKTAPVKYCRSADGLAKLLQQYFPDHEFRTTARFETAKGRPGINVIYDGSERIDLLRPTVNIVRGTGGSLISECVTNLVYNVIAKEYTNVKEPDIQKIVTAIRGQFD
jgi:hypothetical protein